MNWINLALRRPTLSWWDLLDILVVAVLVYEVLKLIRGTRAVQMGLDPRHLIFIKRCSGTSFHDRSKAAGGAHGPVPASGDCK